MKNPEAEIYPVMLTPFTAGNEVDTASLERLIRWYEDGGATGLFAVCLSSEMFYLSLEERVAVARFVRTHSRLPVVASGHLGGDLERQIDDLQAMAETGVDAVVLISNAFATEDESDRQLIDNLETVLARLKPTIPLGIYECPVPYKRVLSDEVFAHIVETGRFSFLKDTCCDIERIERRLLRSEGTPFRLYNAHADTLVQSLSLGAHGYSGVQANCSIKLLRQICDHYADPVRTSESLALLERVAAFCPAHHYPIAAKEILRLRGVLSSHHTRSLDMGLFGEADHTASVSMLNELRSFEEP